MILDAFDKVRLVVENADGFFGEFAAALFHLSDFGASIHEGGADAEVVSGRRGGGKAERVGEDAVNESLGAGGVDFEALLVEDAIEDGAARRARLDDALIVELEIRCGLVVINNEDWPAAQAVGNDSVVEEFGKKNRCGGIDDNVAVGFVVKIGRDAAPAFEVAHVFRDVDRAIQRYISADKRSLKRERRT